MDVNKLIKGIKPKYFWLVSFVLTIIIYTFLFSVSNMLPNGKYIIARNDMPHQMIPFIEYFLRVLKGEHSYFYSWSNGMGGSTAGMYAYYCISPFNLVFLLFSHENNMIAAAIVIILKAGTAAALMQLFLSRFLRSNHYFTILFSIMYSLGSYQVVYYSITNFIDAFYLFPLIMLGIFRLIRKKKFGLCLFSYFMLFLTNFYMGYMTGISSFILGIIYMIYTKRERQWKETFWIIRTYAVTVVSSFLVTAIIWYPAVLELLTATVQDEALDATYLQTTNIFFIYINAFMCATQSYFGYSPLIYCGIPAVLLTILFFFDKNVQSKKRNYAIISILIFVVFMSVEPVDYFMHGFDIPQCFAFRYAFVVSFLMCVFGCREAINIRRAERRNVLWLILGTVVMFIIAYVLNTYVFYKDLNFEWKSLCINAGFVLIWCVLGYVIKDKKTDGLTISCLLTLVIAAELSINGIYSNYTAKTNEVGNEQYELFKEIGKNTAEQIKSQIGPGFYRTNLLSVPEINGAYDYDYYSVTWFNSFENYNVEMLLKKLGMSYYKHGIEGSGMTEPLKSLLGVKVSVNNAVESLNAGEWFYPIMNAKDFVAYEHYSSMSSGGYAPWKENPYALSLGYMVGDETADIKLDGSPFENQEKLLKAMSGISVDCFKDVAGATLTCENGSVRNYARGVSEEEEEVLNKLNSDYVTAMFKGEDPNQDSVFIFEIEGRDKPVLVYFSRGSLYASQCKINLQDMTDLREYIADRRSLTPSYIYNVYPDEEGKCTISITMLKDSTEDVDYIEKTYFAEYDEDEFLRAYDRLSERQLEIESYDDGYLKGKINAGDGGVFFSSIPYDNGWHMYVDGVETEKIPLIEDSFIGAKLGAGEHEIEMKYTNPWFLTGCIISLVGVILIIGFIVFEKRSEVVK